MIKDGTGQRKMEQRTNEDTWVGYFSLHVALMPNSVWFLDFPAFSICRFILLLFYVSCHLFSGDFWILIPLHLRFQQNTIPKIHHCSQSSHKWWNSTHWHPKLRLAWISVVVETDLNPAGDLFFPQLLPNFGMYNLFQNASLTIEKHIYFQAL